MKCRLGLSIIFAFFLTAELFGLSIRVLPGGIPVGNPEQLVREGIRLGNTQLLRQAWDAYEKAVAIDPQYLEGYLQLGRIFFHLSLLSGANEYDFAKAKKYAQTAMDLSPQNPDVHHVMGIVLSGNGAYVDAMDELKLALALNPGNEFIIGDLASIYLALRQPDWAIEYLEGKHLKNGWSYYVLGLAWLQKNQKGKAFLNFKKAEKIGFSDYWLNLAFDSLKRDIFIHLPFYGK